MFISHSGTSICNIYIPSSKTMLFLLITDRNHYLIYNLSIGLNKLQQIDSNLSLSPNHITMNLKVTYFLIHHFITLDKCWKSELFKVYDSNLNRLYVDFISMLQRWFSYQGDFSYYQFNIVSRAIDMILYTKDNLSWKWHSKNIIQDHLVCIFNNRDIIW